MALFALVKAIFSDVEEPATVDAVIAVGALRVAGAIM